MKIKQKEIVVVLYVEQNYTPKFKMFDFLLFAYKTKKQRLICLLQLL
jgi:hypothetical protein